MVFINIDLVGVTEGHGKLNGYQTCLLSN